MYCLFEDLYSRVEMMHVFVDYGEKNAGIFLHFSMEGFDGANRMN